jgi:NitT/TauT family transport system substrate-binding protein
MTRWTPASKHEKLIFPSLEQGGSMRKTVIGGVAVGIAALAFVGSAVGSSARSSGSSDINLAFSTWNGYIGLVIADKEGFWKKRGLNVKYTVIEDPVQRFNALKAGKLNAIATTVDTFSRTNAEGIHSTMVLGLDASVGGDGIVSQKSITSVKALKGQKVAVSNGSTSQWLLAYVLKHNGLSLNDVKQIDMTAGDAGAAFAAGRVPVAVTWQPWLDRANTNKNGHVLVDTHKYPTIIVDEVAFAPSYLKANPGDVVKFIQGYNDAVKLLRTNPEKAFGDVTKYLGQTPAEIKATMKDVPIWSLAQSKAYYGTTSKPGPIYSVFNQSAQFWKSIGQIKSLPNAKQAIDPSFLQKVH